ncbi:transcription factor IIIB 60 kDa subunit-like isoform X2 [Diospyros lotus]|uniref:transcription factor IIIB 60 kDa subunit-like isoform X2 n=1 Tax=Diospyros lotus TaxID=55363 RepID=UPI002253B0BE|nr:transcription factor IIIB 60 kDa subunit-like isoform X2 [Diospyros lotus]
MCISDNHCHRLLPSSPAINCCCHPSVVLPVIVKRPAFVATIRHPCDCLTVAIWADLSLPSTYFRMVWCSSCAKNCERPALYEGFLCCPLCGRVIDQDNFSNEPTFVKNAAGQSQLAGNFVKTVQSDYSASRERILRTAYDDMNNLARGLEMDDADIVLRPAVAFYTIALERNFTRGRRRELVEAACLYIACRENKKPFLLIDFSDFLKINVYVLGGTFLQLCKLLSLEEHPIVQKPVDPSLFIHRFANRLVGDGYMAVSKTSLRIIASMKRDWMQTGRKPSGLCGAALYISALSHGFKCTKSEIVRTVHICEATLTKRLIEFENTESGGLTIEEFNTKAEELERECGPTKHPDTGFKMCGANELLCEHKGSGKAPFAHGLCEYCYDDFVKLSGGLDGGSEPPAFQRAEWERMMKEAAQENVDVPTEGLKDRVDLDMPKNGNEEEHFSRSASKDPATDDAAVNEDTCDKFNGVDGMSNIADDEPENFSDIDDTEVDSYLHNEQEKQYKKRIWEEMNKEYIQEQAAKEAAAAAAKKAYEANFHNCPEEMQAAQELAAAAAAAVAKSRKERQQKRAAEARNLGPAQTAAEATLQMLTKKRLSSKINYDVLEKLFDDPEVPQKAEKSRTESSHSDDDELPHITKNGTESKHDRKDSEWGAPEDEYEDEGDIEQAHDSNSYYENLGGYDYDDDFDCDGF